MPIHWLVCAAGHVERDAFVRAGGGIEACPTCGAARTVTWVHGRPPNSGLFTRKDFGGGVVAETPEDMNRLMDRARRMHPGRDFEMVADSPAERKARVDEHRHRHWVKQQRAGGAALGAEVKEASERKQAEAETSALGRNEAATAAKAEAAKAVGSLAQAAGGGR